MRNGIAAALVLAFSIHITGSAQQKPTPDTAPKTAARATTQQDADKAVAGAGALPAGWKGRLDSPEAKSESFGVANEGSSMKFTTGPNAAGIYYKPSMSAKGNYEVAGAFSQLKPSEHAEGYGLFIGGTDLDRPAQHYTYFLIRQDGKYSIRSRNGDKTAAIVDWTDSAAMKGDPKGMKTSNTLAVHADAAGVHFLIGGTEVQKLTRAQVNPDGIAGLRVNHNLIVQVDKFTVKQAPK